MGNPTVSIQTSFFDAAAFLDEAIASVFAQTFEDWELLLIDDGSTDASSAMALEYARRWPDKVRYLQHPDHANLGISASQNLGLREARGSYIAFLDADDVWLPNKLQEQLSALRSHPDAVMLFGNTCYWYSWTGNPDDAVRDRLIPAGLPPDTLVRPPEFLTRMISGAVPVPCPSDVLVRRDRALAVGGFEEQFRRIFTDQAFYSKLCLNGSVVVADTCWFKYRKHPRSAVSAVKAAGQLTEARTAFLDWLSQYLEQHAAPGELRRVVWRARVQVRYPRFSRRVLSRIPTMSRLGRWARSLLARRRRPVSPGVGGSGT